MTAIEASTTAGGGPPAPGRPDTAASATPQPDASRATGSEASASLRHLLGRLAVVEERVRATVDLRRGADPQPDDRFRGLYVSEAQIGRLLAVGRPGVAEPVAVPESAASLAAVVEREADEAENRGEAIRLRRLAATFELTPLDVELLLVALAPDVDARFERYYGYLNDDVTRRRASVGLAIALCGAETASAVARARLLTHGPLVESGLLAVDDPERPLLSRSLRVPDRVTAHLLGDDAPPALDEILAVDAGDPGTPDGDPTLGASSVAAALRSGASLLYLRDRPGADGREDARLGVALAGTAAVVADLATLDPEGRIPLRDTVRTLVLEARLRDAVLVAGPLDALIERGPAERARAAVAVLAGAASGVVLHGSGPWEPGWSPRVPLVLDAAPLKRHERRTAWSAALGPELGAEAADLPFRLARPAIVRAAAVACLAAAAQARPITLDDVSAGARAGNAAGLERLARRIAPAARWDDLVVPPLVAAQLHELADRARYRERVLDEWRLGRGTSRGRGLTALFAGESGTGKTLAAEVVAADLGLDLYVVDLSTVVDKYIGETEKNLDRIFREATGVNGILLFDEADALFGKRSEVRDARDRYANVEVAYLLQRMESFDGTAILTTNLRANLDEAFTRRLDMLIDLPAPDEPARRRLWQAHLPGTLPTAGDLDIEFVARRFQLAGGGIRNAVAAAAHRAAARGEPVAMADVIHGVAEEYRKLGRLTTEAEFGPYREQLVGEARGEPARAAGGEV